MTSSNGQSRIERQSRMLKTAMGPVIAAALEDPLVIEILLNPDGRLWLDRRGQGRVWTDTVVSVADAERIIRLVASHVQIECHAEQPVVSAELPESGERFEGLLPPVVMAPVFAIRKPAAQIFTLDDYIASGTLSSDFGDVLRGAVWDRQNILIAGGTSTGKTTLANALLAEIATTGDRVVIIEDTRELQCAALDHVTLRTRPGIVTMADLVRSTLRLRPDRIVVGEVRGPEALDMLKAWNTGHPGGVTTLHANGAAGALHRLEQLIQEAVVAVPHALLAEAIDLIVFIAGRDGTRKVETIVRLEGADGDAYQLMPVSAPPTSSSRSTSSQPHSEGSS